MLENPCYSYSYIVDLRVGEGNSKGSVTESRHFRCGMNIR